MVSVCQTTEFSAKIFARPMMALRINLKSHPHKNHTQNCMLICSFTESMLNSELFCSLIAHWTACCCKCAVILHAGSIPILAHWIDINPYRFCFVLLTLFNNSKAQPHNYKANSLQEFAPNLFVIIPKVITRNNGLICAFNCASHSYIQVTLGLGPFTS